MARALKRSFVHFKSCLVIPSLHNQKHCRYLSASLKEIGVLETPKAQGTYDTGQLFLHRIFGYRGVILFPWVATVYDRDLVGKENGTKELKGVTHPYYQVLIDERDMPHTRIDSELVTFLVNEENKRTLFSIPDLDYVAHEDTLPFSTSEKQPINNHMFEKLLKLDTSADKFSATAKDMLTDWQNKHHPWLELTSVYRETTENIRITVMPFYIGSRVVQQTHEYFWRYVIRLENMSEETVQLRERHWRIISLSSTVETVRGRGVKGEEPIFSKAQPVFQYASHVTLQSPSGHMWGTFKMERTDGSTFDVRIPPFALDSKQDDGGLTPHGFII